MSKLIKITLGIALAFLVVGCDKSSETKTSSDSTQTQQVATQANQITVEQQYKKLATGALEYIQNRTFANYHDTTFKQMLEKWTNMCASVEWDIVRVTTIDSRDDGQDFAITAYCEIKDFENVKSNMQKLVSKQYKDLDFQHSGLDKSNEDSYKYYKYSPIEVISGKLHPLLPGGMELVYKKMNDNQRHKVFDYLMDKMYMPFTEALEKSDKIYIAYPFLVGGYYNERDDKFSYGIGYGTTEFGTTKGGPLVELFMGDEDLTAHTFRIAFGIGGQKVFVRTYPLRAYFHKTIDIEESMFFNKSVDFMSLNLEYRIGYAMQNMIISENILAPVIKKIFYNKQEQEQFFKDFAAEIVKIYSESN